MSSADDWRSSAAGSRLYAAGRKSSLSGWRNNRLVDGFQMLVEGNPLRWEGHPSMSEGYQLLSEGYQRLCEGNPRLRERDPRLGYNHHRLGYSHSLVDNQPHECYNFCLAKVNHRNFIKCYCWANDHIPIWEVNPDSMIIFIFKRKWYLSMYKINLIGFWNFLQISTETLISFANWEYYFLFFCS